MLVVFLFTINHKLDVIPDYVCIDMQYALFTAVKKGWCIIGI